MENTCIICGKKFYDMDVSFDFCSEECQTKFECFDGEQFLRPKKKKPEEGDELRLKNKGTRKTTTKIFRSGKWQEKK